MVCCGGREPEEEEEEMTVSGQRRSGRASAETRVDVHSRPRCDLPIERVWCVKPEPPGRGVAGWILMVSGRSVSRQGSANVISTGETRGSAASG